MGSVQWGRPNPKDRDELLGAIWRYQLTRDKTELTSAIKKAFSTHTLGIPSLDAALYQLTQERAITSRSKRGDESITPDLVHSVAHDSFYLLEEVKKILTGAREAKWHTFRDLPQVAAKDTGKSVAGERQEQEPDDEVSSKSFCSKKPATHKSTDPLVDQENKHKLDETSAYEVLKEQGVVADVEDLLG